MNRTAIARAIRQRDRDARDRLHHAVLFRPFHVEFPPTLCPVCGHARSTRIHRAHAPRGKSGAAVERPGAAADPGGAA